MREFGRGGGDDVTVPTILPSATRKRSSWASQAGAGLGAKEFIDRRAVLEAKRRLAHGDGTAAQISNHLGFVTPSQFSRYFMQRTGSSPIDFRKAIRGRAEDLSGD